MSKKRAIVLLVVLSLLAVTLTACGGEKGDFVTQVVYGASQCEVPSWIAEPAAKAAWSADVREPATVVQELCPKPEEPPSGNPGGGTGGGGESVAQNPIVVLAPSGMDETNLPGVTGQELAGLFADYGGGLTVVHTWQAFANALRVNPDSRQPNHGHLWAGTCEGAVFHRGGVNMNLQTRGSDFWLQECSNGAASETWAVWVPWAP